MSSASGHAYREIRRLIVTGAYRAGDRLPEEELSASVGVSRTPIREALHRLDAEGLVVYISNRGVHVASWSDEELTEIFELRCLLEGYAARLAANRATAEEIEQLSQLATEMDGLLDQLDEEARDRVAELNNEFHSVLLIASRSQHLANFTKAVIQVPLVHRTFRRYTIEALTRSFAHHRELVQAVTARDGAWAEAVMRAHILAARHIFSHDDAMPADTDGTRRPEGSGADLASVPKIAYSRGRSGGAR